MPPGLFKCPRACIRSAARPVLLARSSCGRRDVPGYVIRARPICRGIVRARLTGRQPDDPSNAPQAQHGDGAPSSPGRGHGSSEWLVWSHERQEELNDNVPGVRATPVGFDEAGTGIRGARTPTYGGADRFPDLPGGPHLPHGARLFLPGLRFPAGQVPSRA